MTKHSKLKTEENPCETSSDYDFLSCVEDKLVTAAGCRPPWTNLTPSASATPPVRMCSYHYHYNHHYHYHYHHHYQVRECSYQTDSRLLRHYLALMSQVSFMGKDRGNILLNDEYDKFVVRCNENWTMKLFIFLQKTWGMRREKKKEILQISHFFKIANPFVDTASLFWQYH